MVLILRTWLPLVLGPALAMDKIPGPVKTIEYYHFQFCQHEAECASRPPNHSTGKRLGWKRPTHTTQALTSVFQHKVLIGEFVTVDGFATGS